MPLPLLALLHPVTTLTWTRWTVHPSTVIGLAALGALYLWQARRLTRAAATAPTRDALPASMDTGVLGGVGSAAVRLQADATTGAPTGAQRAAFLGALLAVFASLNGPLHDLSDTYLFSAHMVQHLVLALVFPPLLLKGLTAGMVAPLLRLPVVGPMFRLATRPVACFILFNLVLAAWHLPPLYNAAMRWHPVHIAQHLMFMGASVLMWWPIASPTPALPRLPYPGQMLYLFLMSIPMSIVSVYIVYAGTMLYPAYATAPRVWGLSPLEDQRLGGLIMWIPGGLFFVFLMSIIFFRWSSRYDELGSDAALAAPARP